jgi:hypothetical protein
MAEVANRIFADAQGHPFFRCRVCGAPITESDFGDLGLRVPEHGETRDEYCDAELIDDIAHKGCVGASGRGPS